MNELSQLLLDTGLLQFGAFFDGDNVSPLRLQLELLPSYPDILEIIVHETTDKIGKQTERLVCTADALPFGLAVTLKTRIPLVYSRGSDAAPAHDLVGAYDVGHPAVLLTNCVHNRHRIDHLLANARHVGLMIQQLISIVDLGYSRSEVHVDSLLTLTDVIASLLTQGLLPEGQEQAVMAWIEQQRRY